jgi:hypothetical protein
MDCQGANTVASSGQRRRHLPNLCSLGRGFFRTDFAFHDRLKTPLSGHRDVDEIGYKRTARQRPAAWVIPQGADVSGAYEHPLFRLLVSLH